LERHKMGLQSRRRARGKREGTSDSRKLLRRITTEQLRLLH
jgi:hypothetical protein